MKKSKFQNGKQWPFKMVYGEIYTRLKIGVGYKFDIRSVAKSLQGESGNSYTLFIVQEKNQ